MADDNLQAPAVAAKKARGAGYTRTEDYLVCKAFIAASEDPFVGTSQKGKDFRKKMHEKYKELLTQQVRLDQLKYSSATADARLLIPEPAVYEARNPESLYSRFKDTLSLRIMKFLAIEGQTQQDSGSSMEQFYQKCKLIFEKRYPSFGNFDDLRLCKEYLQDKPKYTAYCKVMEEGNKDKKNERPTGSKRAKQEEKDGRVIEKALKEAGCHKDGATGVPVHSFGGYDKMVGVLEQLSSSVIDYWKREEDAKLMEILDTPDKKAYAKEQLAIRLAEARIKRARLEQSLGEVVSEPPKEVNVVTSNTSSTSGDSNTSSKECSDNSCPRSNTVCGAGEYCFNGPKLRIPLSVVCSGCNLKCHKDCVDEEDNGEIICNLCARANHD